MHCRAVLTIQSYRRMLPVRRRFLQQRRAAIMLQAAERGRRARKDYIELKTRHRAAIKVQVGSLSARIFLSMNSAKASLAANCKAVITPSRVMYEKDTAAPTYLWLSHPCTEQPRLKSSPWQAHCMPLQDFGWMRMIAIMKHEWRNACRFIVCITHWRCCVMSLTSESLLMQKPLHVCRLLGCQLVDLDRMH